MTARTRTVSLNFEDYAAFDEIRQKWIKEHKLEISMAAMIKIAMEHYKEIQG